MIAKLELLAMIDRALRTEESAVPIYYRHIGVASRWLDFSDEQRGRVERTLKSMGAESEGHHRELLRLRERISKDARNVL